MVERVRYAHLGVALWFAHSHTLGQCDYGQARADNISPDIAEVRRVYHFRLHPCHHNQFPLVQDTLVWAADLIIREIFVVSRRAGALLGEIETYANHELLVHLEIALTWAI